jgi:putative ABC transport system permease protein
MTFRQIFRIAILSLRGNFLRTTLTSLGVIIGICSLVVVVSVSEGTQREIDAMISSLGAARIDINSGARRGAVSARLMLGGLYSLTDADAEAIQRQIPRIKAVNASLRGSVQIMSNGRNWTTTWQAVQAEFAEVNSYVVAQGTRFQPRDFGNGTKVIILGETVRKRLFGSSQPVGQRVQLNNSPYLVVGTLQPKGQGGFNQDLDDTALVPLETGRRYLMGDFPIPHKAVQQISIKVNDSSDMASTQSRLENLLRERHRIKPGADDDFYVGNVSEIVKTRTRSTRLMSLLLSAVAAVCLIVGGIGIMNIMLVSVTERYSEIGLRMAVGAAPADVRAQFLVEAVMISLLGGVIGIVLGVLAALTIAHTGAFEIAINFRVLFIAALFSVITGIAFGYYPARRASSLDPIVALRRT